MSSVTLNMERSRKRSASQASSPSIHRSRPPGERSPSVPRSTRRQPLRPVAENSHALRTPGPLESMLKTTTETGDIGIFSIGPSVPLTSPVSFHRPPRQRPRLDQATLHPLKRHNDHEVFRDDRRRLPSSYRDTTSEIISLYASDTQRSWSRSFSPSVDGSRRSYSLTTCSSQAVPSHKSFATISSAGPGAWQRPRSPYPYHTRLKRHGGRSFSPAMTDSGVVECMNRDDGESSSQVGPPDSFNQRHRRLRPDANRSMGSLSARASPGPCNANYSSVRSRTPRSPWHTSSVERGRQVSNPHSLRTSSLTSVMDMYRCDPYNKAPEAQAVGSFYYDYTEEFEHPDIISSRTPVTLCPIPQRSNSINRPFVLHDHDPESPDVPQPQGSESTDYQSRITDEKEIQIASDASAGRTSISSEEYVCEAPSSEPQNDEQDLGKKPDSEGNHPAEYPLSLKIPRVSGRSSSSNEAMDKHGHWQDNVASPGAHPSPLLLQTPTVQDATIHVGAKEMQSAPCCQPELVAQTNAGSIANTWAGNAASTKRISTQRMSSGSLSRIRDSLDPALAEFAGIFASFDRLARSPFSKAGDDTYISSREINRGRRWPLNPEDAGRLGSPKQAGKGGLHIQDRPGQIDSSRRYLSEGEANRPNEPEWFRAPLMRFFGTYPINAQVSPPHLMKPLPPLPDDTTAGNITDARVILDDTSRPGPPRLRLRNRHPRPIDSSEDRASPVSQDVGPVVPPKQESPSASPKLRLKLSRARLGIRSTKSATVLRSPALKQCNALAEFQHCAQKDLFTPKSRLADAFIPPATSGDGNVKGPNTGDNQDIGTSPSATSDQFDIPYPPTPHTLHKSSEAQMQGSRASSDQSELGDERRKGHKRLRHKLSHLRLRLTGTPLGRHAREMDAAPLFQSMNHSTPSFQLESLGIETPEKESRWTQNDTGHNGRVKRWANSAKEVLRWYVKRTLDKHVH